MFVLERRIYLFYPFQARINKRGRKLVDYDRYRHNLEVNICRWCCDVLKKTFWWSVAHWLFKTIIMEGLKFFRVISLQWWLLVNWCYFWSAWSKELCIHKLRLLPVSYGYHPWSLWLSLVFSQSFSGMMFKNLCSNVFRAWRVSLERECTCNPFWSDLTSTYQLDSVSLGILTNFSCRNTSGKKLCDCACSEKC